MRRSEKFKIAATAAKGGAAGTTVAAGLGWATVKTTVLFGLIPTGVAVSLPILAACAVGGAAIYGATSLLSKKIHDRLIEREFDEAMGE